MFPALLWLDNKCTCVSCSVTGYQRSVAMVFPWRVCTWDRLTIWLAFHDHITDSWSLAQNLKPLERFSSVAKLRTFFFFCIIVCLHKNLIGIIQHLNGPAPLPCAEWLVWFNLDVAALVQASFTKRYFRGFANQLISSVMLTSLRMSWHYIWPVGILKIRLHSTT